MNSWAARRSSGLLIVVLTLLCAMLIGYLIGIVLRRRDALPTALLATTSPTALAATAPARQTALLSAGADAPTATVAPSATAPVLPVVSTAPEAATVTATPSVTASARPRATAAPGVTAAGRLSTTAAPRATASPTLGSTRLPALEQLVVDTFSSTDSGWLVRDTGRSSSAYVAGRYRLMLKGETNISVSSTLLEDSYRVSADVQVETGQAGLVFLSSKPTTFYRLLIDNAGNYAIERQQADETSYAVDWTASDALNAGDGVLNRLVVERRGGEIRVQANDQPLGEVFVLVPADDFIGQYGFALTAGDGAGSATFDNLLVERLPEP